MTTNELGTNGGSDTSSSLSQSPTSPAGRETARTGREKQRYDEHEQRLVAGYVTRVFFTLIPNPSPALSMCDEYRQASACFDTCSVGTRGEGSTRTLAEHLHHPPASKAKARPKCGSYRLTFASGLVFFNRPRSNQTLTSNLVLTSTPNLPTGAYRSGVTPPSRAASRCSWSATSTTTA